MKELKKALNLLLLEVGLGKTKEEKDMFKRGKNLTNYIMKLSSKDDKESWEKFHKEKNDKFIKC